MATLQNITTTYHEKGPYCCCLRTPGRWRGLWAPRRGAVRGVAQVSGSAWVGGASAPQVHPLDSGVLQTCCHGSPMAGRQGQRLGSSVPEPQLPGLVTATSLAGQASARATWQTETHKAAVQRVPANPRVDRTLLPTKAVPVGLSPSPHHQFRGWQVRPILWMGKSLRFRKVACSGCLAGAEQSRDLNPGVSDCRSATALSLQEPESSPGLNP